MATATAKRTRSYSCRHRDRECPCCSHQEREPSLQSLGTGAAATAAPGTRSPRNQEGPLLQSLGLGDPVAATTGPGASLLQPPGPGDPASTVTGTRSHAAAATETRSPCCCSHPTWNLIWKEEIIRDGRLKEGILLKHGVGTGFLGHEILQMLSEKSSAC